MRITPGEQPNGLRGEQGDAVSPSTDKHARKQDIPPHMRQLLLLADEASGGPSPDPAAPFVSSSEQTRGAMHKAYELAQRREIKIRPSDFGIELGETTPRPMTQLANAIKGGLPFTKNRTQRFKELAEAVEEEVARSRTDRGKSQRLSEWFSVLNPDERAQLQVEPAAVGTPSWMQPLIVRVGNDAARIFNAGYLMDLPSDVLDALPPETRQWLEDRRETWANLGVDNGTQARRFIDEHFTVTPIDIEGTLPPELARLCELEPALRDKLRSLQERGLAMQFVKAEHTPGAVLDAVRNLAQSQRAFVSHWLRGLIEDGETPKLTAADFEAIAKGHLKSYRKALKRLDGDGLEAQLTKARLSDALESRLDFVGSADLIRDFSGSAMSIALVSGGPEQRKELAQINCVVHEYFGSEWASRSIGLDDSARVGEGVRETLMTLLWLSPLAEIVQRVAHVDGIAKFMAGSFDNLAAEKGELQTWSAAGVPKEDLLKRAAFLAPVVAVDLDLSMHIDDIARTLGPHIAGGAFSLSAVLLPLFTGLFSMQYFAGQYRKLDREGKLPNGTKLSEDDRAALDEVASKEGLIRRVSSALDKHKAEPAVRDSIVAAMQKMDMPWIEQNPDANVQGISRKRATLKGVKEAMVVNQAQLGLMAASLSSILVGFGLGDLILHDATLEALTGAAEVPLALLSLKGVRVANRHSWNQFVNNREPLGLLGADGTGGEIATA